jgi:hypothetical protein
MSMMTKVGPGGTELIKRCDASTAAVESDTWVLHEAVRHAQVTLDSDDGSSLPDAYLRCEEAKERRREFWADTCREPSQKRLGFKIIGELHRKYGWRFCTPSPEQVQRTLDKLDEAVASWDKQNQQIFYEVLEREYPELLRYRPNAKASR